MWQVIAPSCKALQQSYSRLQSDWLRHLSLCSQSRYFAAAGKKDACSWLLPVAKSKLNSLLSSRACLCVCPISISVCLCVCVGVKERERERAAQSSAKQRACVWCSVYCTVVTTYLIIHLDYSNACMLAHTHRHGMLYILTMGLMLPRSVVSRVPTQSHHAVHLLFIWGQHAISGSKWGPIWVLCSLSYNYPWQLVHLQLVQSHIWPQAWHVPWRSC